MADENPFAKYATQTAENPFAKYATPEGPGVLEDVVKGGGTGLAEGVIGLPGAGGDLQELAGHVAGKPMGWLAQKFDENFPTLSKFLKEQSEKSSHGMAATTSGGDIPGTPLPSSADIKAPIEKVTGPFYQAKTPAGKIAQTAGQVAPAIALGGESLAGTAAKAVGAGLGSEGAGEAANALKGGLPDSVQPYAEPVARAVGAGGGLFLPSAARKIITPLPMTDERLATVNALRGTNPELVDASTAGQLTESPRIATLEGRAPRMANLPKEQAEAYTRGVMRQAGSNGLFDTAGLAEAKNTGAQLEALRAGHNISPSEFLALNRGVAAERAALFRTAGKSEPFDRIRDEIRGGPTGGNPMPLDMTGPRYGYMRQITQSAADAAPSTHEANSLYNVRGRLDQAFHNSVPTDVADTHRNLNQQYSNFKTIENIPTKVGQNTVTPNQVSGKAQRGSPLETHAEQAASVMGPLPPRNTEVGDVTSLIGSLMGAATHGGAGYAAGGGAGAVAGAGEGALTGLFTAPHYVNAAKDIAGRVVARPSVQAFLKNQAWRPGPNSTTDRATLLRLLMTPPVEQLGGPRQ